MNAYIAEISCQNRPFKLNRVNEGKSVSNPFESAAHKLQIKPNARKPGAKICKQRSAYTTNLLVGKNTSAKKSDTDEQKGNWDDKKNGKDNVHSYLKPEN